MLSTEDDDAYADSNYISSSVPRESNNENGMEEPGTLKEMLTRLDIELAYTSEKSLNLDLYMAILSLRENGFGELKNISEVEIEEILIFDLLFGYFDSEVTELGLILNNLQSKIIDARRKVYLYRQRSDMFNDLREKLHGCQNSWKSSQETLLGMKQQLTNLQKILAIVELNSTYSIVEENSQSYGFDLQTTEQQRTVLRMLEQSIAGQLDLETLLLESKEMEEELKMKLLRSNEVIFEMETFTEVAFERALEAEYLSEICMRNLKEVICRLQTLHFNLHCSSLRETKLNSEFQSCLNQLKIKETSLVETEINNSKLNRKLQDKEALEEKVKVLEGKLKETEASYIASEEQISHMENAVRTLTERMYLSESRTQEAEGVVATLKEENMELKEEIGFLKGGDNHEEKVSFLEEQVRDYESQLQNARAQSESYLEQQSLLYSAIWDMETMVEELKSKVSKAENRAEKAEEECLVLGESNAKLNKKIRVLKSKSEVLEECLKEGNREKQALVKEVNDEAKLISDMVKKLATERERIQKQICSLSRENNVLKDELWKLKAKQDNKDEYGNNKCSINNSSVETSTLDEIEEIPLSVSASNKVDDEPSELHLIDDGEGDGSSISVDDESGHVEFTNNEDQTKRKNNLVYKKCSMFAVILVAVLSVIAMNVKWYDLSTVFRHSLFFGLG